MREKLSHLLTSVHLDCFVSRDNIVGAVGRRSGALFFARHRDYFIMTRNSQPLPGLGTLAQLHRDPKLCTVYQDWQKTRHRDHAEVWQAPTATN